jgi:hypothetical protein
VGAVAGFVLAVASTVATIACTPIPEDFGRSAGASGEGGAGSPVVAASPGVTMDGTKVTIVGQGASKSDPFELPAGAATVVITACRSNQVMPFISISDDSGATVALIVDPEKVVNLAGGTYRVSAQTNPDCLWQVEITPPA